MILPAFHCPVNGTFVERTAGSIPLTGKPTFAPDDFAQSQLTRHEANQLLAFAQRHMPVAGMPATVAFEGVGKLTSADQLKLSEVIYRVFHDKMDRSTREQQDLHSLRNCLGVLTEFDRKMYSQLRAHYGAQHLAGLHVIYNGHATAAILSLFPMAHALGMEIGSYWRSTYSGDRGIAPVLNGFLGSLSNQPGRDFNLGALRTEQVIEQLMGPGDIVVLNGGPKLAKLDLPLKVRERIARGNIRFVIHNAADHVAMRSFGTDIWALNLADSMPKGHEIKVIGKQLIHHVDNGCRTYNGRSVEDGCSIVIGHGNIGSSVRAALQDNCVPYEAILVIDPSTAAQARAVAKGVGRVHSRLPNDTAQERFGSIFVASNDNSGLGVKHLTRLPERCVVAGANSGGIGVDVKGIMERYSDIREDQADEAAHGLKDGENGVFRHIVCAGPKTSDIPKQIVFLNCRTDADGTIRVYAPNLNNTFGQEALPTGGMLVAATCAVRQLREPGVASLPEHITEAVRQSAWKWLAPPDAVTHDWSS